jgi:hypothetical protein
MSSAAATIAARVSAPLRGSAGSAGAVAPARRRAVGASDPRGAGGVARGCAGGDEVGMDIGSNGGTIDRS